jgi:hypothetical protein
MSTFDKILPKLTEIFARHGKELAQIAPVLINRDLNGRVRLIADEKWVGDERASAPLDKIAHEMCEALGPHAYTAEQSLLFEPDVRDEMNSANAFPLEGNESVFVADRLAAEGNWSSISPISNTVPRLVFYSIKGGVGRSTALAAIAWDLAETGKRVLVLDLDLESPGLSSSLLPEDRRPSYGIADWLVEDLVNNGGAVFDSLLATSPLSHNGEILIVPAHGMEAGEYISKLGRVWMPKVNQDGTRELWSARLRRLILDLEQRWSPDVLLVDSRAGIDEVAAACLTDLSASTILLFAIDGDETWSGYRILFRHWRTTGVARQIRERLQVVGAMLPETDTEEYFAGLRERAWVTFSEELYDEVPPGSLAGEEGNWNFDETDQGAPHYPWGVRWHRGFAAVRNLHARLERVDSQEVRAIFGPLVEGVELVTTVSEGKSL